MIRRGAIRVNQVPGGGGGANPAQGATVWNPGAAPAEGYVTTWTEVMESFAESTGEFTVFLDDAGGGAFTIPAGTYEADSRLKFARSAPAVGQLTVSLADGAVLRNLAGVYRNITLETNGTATTALPLDTGRAIEFDLGSILDNQGSVPALSIGAGNTARLGFYRGSGALATGDEVATIGAGATLTVDIQASPSSGFSANLWTGTGTLAYRYDMSFSPPTLASPPTTITTTNFDFSSGYLWSPIDFTLSAGTVVNQAGNFTSGIRFRPLKEGLTCAGIRTYWAGVATTLRFKLWSPAGVQMATVDKAVGAAEEVTAIFGAPVATPITAGGGINFFHTVSVWDTSGVAYTRYAGPLFGLLPSNISSPITPPALTWMYDFTQGYFVAGDGWPNGTIGNTYLIEPLIL